jgi:hypothetical protein
MVARLFSKVCLSEFGELLNATSQLSQLFDGSFTLQNGKYANHFGLLVESKTRLNLGSLEGFSVGFGLIRLGGRVLVVEWHFC